MLPTYADFPDDLSAILSIDYPPAFGLYYHEIPNGENPMMLIL